MPVLPTAENLGRAPELRSQSVVPIQLGRAEEAQARAAQSDLDAGRALSGLGETLFDATQRIQEREDRLTTIKEKSNFLQSMVSAESEIGAEGDTDYKTYGTRFSEKLTTAKQEAAAKIKHAGMRAQFEADADLDIQQGVSRMAAKSWALEVDNGVADVQAVSAQNRELAMRTKDPEVRASLLHNTQLAIQSALKNGYIKPSDAEELGRKTAQDYSMAYVNSQHPSEQLRLLKESGGVADMIPTDVRVAMTEKAESDMASLQAKIETVAKRQREALLNAASLSVEKNGNLSEIPPNVWAVLDLDQRKQLSEYSKYVAEGRNIATDPIAFNDLWTMASSPQTQQAFLETDLNGYLTKLSKEDRQALIKEQAKIRSGGTSEIARGYQNTNQMIQTSLRGAGYDPTPKEKTTEADAVARLNYLVNQKVSEEKARLGKKQLSTEEEQKIIDQFFIPKTMENQSWISKTVFGEDKKKAFEVTLDDITDDDRKVLEASLTELGRPITDDNVLDLYLRFKE
jgi:hypothetical protein